MSTTIEKELPKTITRLLTLSNALSHMTQSLASFFSTCQNCTEKKCLECSIFYTMRKVMNTTEKVIEEYKKTQSKIEELLREREKIILLYAKSKSS